MAHQLESALFHADEFATGPAGAAWSALASWLKCRGAQLREEVRDYPTPIARCDVQLTKLLEHRGGVLAACQLMQSLEVRASGPFPTREAVDAALAEAPATDDPAEARLRERLRSSLYSIPCPD
jgi:hypothetical protein